MADALCCGGQIRAAGREEGDKAVCHHCDERVILRGGEWVVDQTE